MPKDECPEKLALLLAVQKAMGDLMTIHNDEMAALLKEDFTELARLRRTLSVVRADKAGKIDAYRDHVMMHRC